MIPVESIKHLIVKLRDATEANPLVPVGDLHSDYFVSTVPRSRKDASSRPSVVSAVSIHSDHFADN